MSEVKAVIRQELTAAGHCVPYAEPERQVFYSPPFSMFAHVSVRCQIRFVARLQLILEADSGRWIPAEAERTRKRCQTEDLHGCEASSLRMCGRACSWGHTEAAHAPGNACLRSAAHSLKQPCLEVASWVSRNLRQRRRQIALVTIQSWVLEMVRTFPIRFSTNFVKKASHDGAGHQPRRR